MDWKALMQSLNEWLWQAPYLDIPNYAWIAAGLTALVVILYLISLARSGSGEQEETREPGEPETAEAPEPPAREIPEPESLEKEREAKPRPPGPEPEQAEPATPAPEEPRREEEPAAEPSPPPETPAPQEPSPAPAAELEEPLPRRREKPELEEELIPPEGIFARLKKGLLKTQEKLGKGLSEILAGRAIDDETLEEIEELLITSDLGVNASLALIERMREAVKKQGLKTAEELKSWLKEEIKKILEQVEQPLVIPEDHEGPFVIMVTGVNGTGKTTTIGKLALRYKQEGKKVMLAAADTFRAAAIDQLKEWARRADCPVIAHQEGADPSAVAFDAVKAAQARGIDVLIIDTAGRLHTKVNLMEELKKVKRITGRELPGAPHEIMLVLDATTGQNALLQAKTFNQALGVTGITLTKLDGTAKGGIIVAVSDELKIPIRFIGVGEKISDLQPFNAADFAQALFS